MYGAGTLLYSMREMHTALGIYLLHSQGRGSCEWFHLGGDIAMWLALCWSILKARGNQKLHRSGTGIDNRMFGQGGAQEDNQTRGAVRGGEGDVEKGGRDLHPRVVWRSWLIISEVAEASPKWDGDRFANILFQFKSKSWLDEVRSPSAIPLYEHCSLGKTNTHEKEFATMNISVKGKF